MLSANLALAARLRGHTATQCSKKGSENQGPLKLTDLR